MSEKRQIPTMRVLRAQASAWLEGPVVSPDRTDSAASLTDVHRILRAHGGLLVHDGEWVYVPCHAIAEVRRGGRMFSLPWPLVDSATGSAPER